MAKSVVSTVVQIASASVGGFVLLDLVSVGFLFQRDAYNRRNSGRLMTVIGLDGQERAGIFRATDMQFVSDPQPYPAERALVVSSPTYDLLLREVSPKQYVAANQFTEESLTKWRELDGHSDLPFKNFYCNTSKAAYIYGRIFGQ